MLPPPSESHQTTGTAFKHLGGTSEHGGSVNHTARKGRPDAAAHSARRSGSNSKASQYGDCRHCPRSFTLQADGTIPPHHPPAGGRGPHALCQGAGEPPVAYLEAADGSNLLEA